MFGQANQSVVRTIVGTVGAVALSTVFIFAAAGPAKANVDGIAASHVSIQLGSTARPLVY